MSEYWPQITLSSSHQWVSISKQVYFPVKLNAVLNALRKATHHFSLHKVTDEITNQHFILTKRKICMC